MQITTEFITIQGARLQGMNPLPQFKYNNPDGACILPYNKQDSYGHKKEAMQLTTIVLENEYLRAQFLPQYGGRLYSLRNQKTKEELLFRNCVMQPANFAIRDAWFSGGIEWNIGYPGHSFSTFDKVFFTKIECADGYTFLRMYDYERTEGLFWQIDFHLPNDSRQLFAHVVVINDHSHIAPFHWWTNTAVREEPGCRIFSDSKKFHSPDSFHNDIISDFSYPLNVPNPGEYFFEPSPSTLSPWEAITYTDGTLFFERSTHPLDAKGVFCWGVSVEGRKQMHALSVEGKADYLELQAGLTSDKSMGGNLQPQSSISFTQAFGSLALDPEDTTYSSYDVSHSIVRTAVNNTLSATDMLEKEQFFHKLSTLPGTKLLHMGSGFGALELMRRMFTDTAAIPIPFDFPAESLTEEQFDWLAIIQQQEISELSDTDLPPSWITDINYVPLLMRYLDSYPDNLKALLYLSVIFYETDHFSVAKSIWKKALAIRPLPIFYRNLACAARQEGSIEEALQYMKEAVHPRWLEMGLNSAYMEEYNALLLQIEQ